MERQKIIFSAKIKKQKKRSFSLILFRFTLWIFFIAGIYILFFSPFMQVSLVRISGNKYLEEKNISGEIEAALEGKYFGIADKSNLLLFSKNKIKKSLLGKFKQIKEIEIKKDFPSGLAVSVWEREMKMAASDGKKYYFLDENGEAYDIISLDSGAIEKNNLLVLTDESGKEIFLGKKILNLDYMEYILGIREKLKEEMDLEVENYFWTPNIISNDIRVKTKEGWKIYFSSDIDLKKEMEMLRTFLKKEIETNRRPDLEYVDLRINNKIYYKLK